MVKVLWTFLLASCLFPGASNQALDSIQALESRKEVVATQKVTDATDAYVLTFFYMGSCPHCHRFAPVLESYAKETGLMVQSFTLDGKVMEGFEEAKYPDAALQESFFPDNSIKTPALFLVHVERGDIYTVAIGALTKSELKARMDALRSVILSQRKESL